MRFVTCDEDVHGAVADVLRVIDRVRDAETPVPLPCVTLSYAQSLDGSIAACRGQALALSGDAALDFTHRLRALHDAILVGVNTVLVDNPRLNVRRVEGPDPRPVVVDSQLRTPLDCRLLRRCADAAAPTIIATTHGACAEKAARLRASGAEVWCLPATEDGRVDLLALFARLRTSGITSVMVEGGGSIITSVLGAGLANQLVVTVAPRLVGGVRAVGPLDASRAQPKLARVQYFRAGDDLLVHSEFAR